MPDMYRVLRPFEGANGRRFQPGDVVDTTDWKWTQQLVARRVITPVTGNAEPNRAPAPRRAS